MEENLKVLNELSKGSKMGMDAIKSILSSCNDDKLKKELEKEYDDYKSISKKVNKLYSSYSNEEIDNTSIINRVMTFYGIKMKTLKDKSNSKLAELMLQGTNMGIIEGRRLLNSKNVDNKVNKLMEEFIEMQEKNVEILKTYL